MGHAIFLPLVPGFMNRIETFGQSGGLVRLSRGEIAARCSCRWFFAYQDLLPPLRSAASIEGEKAEGLSATVSKVQRRRGFIMFNNEMFS